MMPGPALFTNNHASGVTFFNFLKAVRAYVLLIANKFHIIWYSTEEFPGQFDLF